MPTRPDRAAVLTNAVDLKHELAAARYRDDVWAWISECVTTVDELDPQTPIKPFPTRVCVRCAIYLGGRDDACDRCGDPTRPLIYLRDLARQWQSANPPLLIVPKARRMRLSWLFVAAHVWGALHWPHAKIFFVSSKEEKSGELVERAHGILARLPPHGGGGRLVGQTASPPSVRLDNGAAIIGVAEGASQLRQYTSSAVLADEFGPGIWTARRPGVMGRPRPQEAPQPAQKIAGSRVCWRPAVARVQVRSAPQLKMQATRGPVFEACSETRPSQRSTTSLEAVHGGARVRWSAKAETATRTAGRPEKGIRPSMCACQYCTDTVSRVLLTRGLTRAPRSAPAPGPAALRARAAGPPAEPPAIRAGAAGAGTRSAASPGARGT
jgi:hypothetical protein